MNRPALVERARSAHEEFERGMIVKAIEDGVVMVLSFSVEGSASSSGGSARRSGWAFPPRLLGGVPKDAVRRGQQDDSEAALTAARTRAAW